MPRTPQPTDRTAREVRTGGLRAGGGVGGPLAGEAFVATTVWPLAFVVAPVALALGLHAAGVGIVPTVWALAMFGGGAFGVCRAWAPDLEPLLHLSAIAVAGAVVVGGPAAWSVTVPPGLVVVLAVSAHRGLRGALVGVAALAVALSFSWLVATGRASPGWAQVVSVVAAAVSLAWIGIGIARAAPAGQELLEVLFEDADGEVVVVERGSDAVWRLVRANAAARRRGGAAGWDAGRRLADLEGPLADAAVLSALERGGAPASSRRVAVSVPAGASGELRRYSLSVLPVVASDGRPRLAAISVLDHSGEHGAVHQLAERERLLRAVAEAVPFPLYWTDASGRVAGCNARFARACGLPSPSEVVAAGARLSRPGGEAEEAADRRVLQGAPAGGDGEVPSGAGPVDAAFEAAASAGPATLPPGFETVRTPFRGADGRVDGVVGMLLDGVRAADRRTRPTPQRNAAGRLAGAFVHEFRNLLLVMDANARLVADGLARDNPVREDLAEIEAASRRAVALLARLEAFNAPLAAKPGAYPLDTLVRDTAVLLRRLVRAELVVEELLASSVSVALDRAVLEQSVLEVALPLADRLDPGGRLRIVTSFELGGSQDGGEDAPVAQVLVEAVPPGSGGVRPMVPTDGFAEISESIAAELGGRLLVESLPGGGVRVRLLVPVSPVAVGPPVPIDRPRPPASIEA